MADTHFMNDESVILKWNNGIKLVNSKKILSLHSPNSVAHPLKDILALPLNVYFLNTDSAIQKMNETAAEKCGFQSAKDAYKKTAAAVAKPISADLCMKHDKEVMRTQKMQIIEEHFYRLDGVNKSGVSIKFPWYNERNQIIGVFGLSFATLDSEMLSLTEYLKLIANTGLLTNSNSNHSEMLLPGLHFQNVYLTNREVECLCLFMRGMTIKLIAKALNISPRTVESHWNNIKVKMQISSKAELIEKLSVSQNIAIL